MTLKGSGESFAQIAAEKANPKLDVWFGGTGDPHLQAAEQGLLEEYKSPLLAQLQPWAQKQAEQSKYRTVGIYLGALGIGYNTELLAKKKVAAPACWKDLVKPEFAGEVQMANPNASGTAYTAIATLVQVFGEEEAFKYLKALHKNINNYPRSGVAPIKAAARGETLASVSFIHDVVTEAQAGFPVKGVAPCEGTGYEIGSLSIVKGARNLDNAKKFVDWALTAKAQALGAQAKQFQIPSNVERADLAAVAEARRHQAHQLRLREVRHVGRAQAPARALGQGSRLDRQIARTRAIIARPAHRRGPSPTESRMIRRSLVAVAAATALLAAAAGRGPAQPLLQLAQHRVVPGHGHRLREGDRHQGRGRPEGHRRNAGADQGRARQSQGRHLVGRPRRRLPAGGRGRPARDLPVAEPRAAARLGAAHHRGLAEPRRPASTAASSRSATTPSCRRRRSCRSRSAGRTCSIPSTRTR